MQEKVFDKILQLFLFYRNYQQTRNKHPQSDKKRHLQKGHSKQYGKR